MLTSVMYHYVRNAEDTPYRGINAVREEAFIRQVNHLMRTASSLNIGLIKELLNNPSVLEHDLFALTFDDGLKEHAHFVTDVLSDKKIPGFFFIPSAPITEGRVLPVHKNHFLLSELEISAYTEMVKKELDHRAIEMDWQINLETLRKTYRWDDASTALLKYVLNYKLDNIQRELILDAIFASVFGDEKAFASALYVSIDELKQMESSGMIIGGHSHSHNVLSHLSDEKGKEEIDRNFRFLEKVLGSKDLWTFSYPFGKKSTYNNQLMSCLRDWNVHIAFNTEIGPSDRNTPFLEINRIDPKDIAV